ncbi:MAG: hypothetical protein Q9210_006212 [Variospora velana]
MHLYGVLEEKEWRKALQAHVYFSGLYFYGQMQPVQPGEIRWDGGEFSSNPEIVSEATLYCKDRPLKLLELLQPSAVRLDSCAHRRPILAPPSNPDDSAYQKVDVFPIGFSMAPMATLVPAKRSTHTGQAANEMLLMFRPLHMAWLSSAEHASQHAVSTKFSWIGGCTAFPNATYLSLALDFLLSSLLPAIGF